MEVRLTGKFLKIYLEIRPWAAKDKSKNRDARRAGKFVKRKSGIPELEGYYYFSHGEERAGARYNKVVEKILTMQG